MREVSEAKKMATAFTPERNRHANQVANAPSSQPPSRVASPQLNATVRYPPPDPLRLFSSSGARDATSLAAIARQIVTALTQPSVPTSQSSSFVALRPSHTGSAADVATRAAPRSRRASLIPHPNSLLALEQPR